MDLETSGSIYVAGLEMKGFGEILHVRLIDWRSQGGGKNVLRVAIGFLWSV